jgi:hypothetical protein
MRFTYVSIRRGPRRVKDVAHLAFKDPNIRPPIIRKMFDAAQTTAMLLDKLAQALGCTGIDMEFERKEQHKSADAFWAFGRLLPRNSLE